MRNSKSASLVLISAMLGMAAPVYSQQSPDAAKGPAATSAPPATQAPADTAPSGPTAETLKRANAVGLRPEVRKGGTVYCWESADIGTRFKTKKCVDENRLVDMVQQLEAQRDQKQQGR
jgi:hypothetical protein